MIRVQAFEDFIKFRDNKNSLITSSFSVLSISFFLLIRKVSHERISRDQFSDWQVQTIHEIILAKKNVEMSSLFDIVNNYFTNNLSFFLKVIMRYIREVFSFTNQQTVGHFAHKHCQSIPRNTITFPVFHILCSQYV